MGMDAPRGDPKSLVDGWWLCPAIPCNVSPAQRPRSRNQVLTYSGQSTTLPLVPWSLWRHTSNLASIEERIMANTEGQ